MMQEEPGIYLLMVNGSMKDLMNNAKLCIIIVWRINKKGESDNYDVFLRK